MSIKTNKKTLTFFIMFTLLFSSFLGMHDFSYADSNGNIFLGVRLIEGDQITRDDITIGATDLPSKPIFKINFSHGIYTAADHNFQYIHLYDLDDGNKEVEVELTVLEPFSYGDDFKSYEKDETDSGHYSDKERKNAGNIDKSRSIQLEPKEDLKAGGRYQLFIGKEVKANNNEENGIDVKKDFTVHETEPSEPEPSEPEEPSEESCVKLVKNGQISEDVFTGATDIPLKPILKIDFPNGIYIDPERPNTKGLDFKYNSQYIHLYDLDNNQKVSVHLEMLMPGAYGEDARNEGKFDKSQSISVEPQEELRAGGNYRLLIEEGMKAKHGRSAFGEDKILDFTTAGDSSQEPNPSNTGKAVLNAKGDKLVLTGLSPKASNLEYRILKDNESFGEWHSIKTDKNGRAEIEGNEELNGLQEGKSKVEIRVSEKKRISGIHIVGKDEPEAFKSIDVEFTEEENQLLLTKFPSSANNFEYRIAIDGANFGEDWKTFPTWNVPKTIIEIPNDAIKNTSKIELARVDGWLISKTVFAIENDSTSDDNDGNSDNDGGNSGSPAEEPKNPRPLIELRGVRLVKDGEVSDTITNETTDMPLKPMFKINFSNGVYRVKDYNFKYIYLCDLDNSQKKVDVNLRVAAPGTYGDFFDDKERANEGNIEKSRSITLEPKENLREGGRYRLFIGKEVMANNTGQLNKDIKIDFKTVSSKSDELETDETQGSKPLDVKEVNNIEEILSKKNDGLVQINIGDEKQKSIELNVAKLSGKDNLKTLTLPKEIVKILQEKDVELVIKDLNKKIIIPAQGFKEEKDIYIGIKPLENQGKQKEIKNGQIFELIISSGEDKNYLFEKEITVNISLEDKNSIKRIVVYKFNEQKNEWEYVKNEIKDKNIVYLTNGSGKYLVGESIKTFFDIQNHWAKDAIESMADRNIANGIDAQNFAPDNKITRAQAATLLSKILELDENADMKLFNDVDDDAWYADYMSKAIKAGILKGDNNQLRPNDPITREEMACMLSNAYHYKGKKIDKLKDIGFKDKAHISYWAEKSIQEVYTLEIIKGRPDGSFGVKDHVTRAESIIMLKNLLEKIEKTKIAS